MSTPDAPAKSVTGSVAVVVVRRGGGAARRTRGETFGGLLSTSLGRLFFSPSTSSAIFGLGCCGCAARDDETQQRHTSSKASDALVVLRSARLKLLPFLIRALTPPRRGPVAFSDDEHPSRR